MIRTMMIKPAESVVAYFQTLFLFSLFHFFLWHIPTTGHHHPPKQQRHCQIGDGNCVLSWNELFSGWGMVVLNEAYVVCCDGCWMHWPPNLWAWAKCGTSNPKVNATPKTTHVCRPLGLEWNHVTKIQFSAQTIEQCNFQSEALLECHFQATRAMSAMPRTAVCNAPCNERGGPRYDMDDGAANSAFTSGLRSSGAQDPF